VLSALGASAGRSAAFPLAMDGRFRHFDFQELLANISKLAACRFFFDSLLVSLTWLF
jgi:hypothetical protein